MNTETTKAKTMQQNITQEEYTETPIEITKSTEISQITETKETTITTTQPEKNTKTEKMERKQAMGKILRYYRKLNKLSIKNVSEILSEHFDSSADKTIYGWENGSTQPNADIFLFLCKLYQIEDILDAFGYGIDETEQPKLQPTAFEYELLKQYREHSEMHTAIHKLLDIDN